MDGTLAAIFLVASLTDMALTDCPTQCLAQNDAISRLSFQVAKVEFETKIIGNEFYLGYDLPTQYGPFHPTVGASITDMGSLWVGAGAKWTTLDLIDSPVFIEASLMPGIYAAGDGLDIGGALQFRSSLGAGIAFTNGMTVLASYDHRSNADTQARNPGLETIALRVAFPF
jgi:hypothetical protein